jgi:hypothetical protein
MKYTRSELLASRTGENGMIVKMYGSCDDISNAYIYYKDNCGNHTKGIIRSKREKNEVIDMLKYGHNDQDVVGYLNYLYWEGYSDNLIDKI